MPHGSLHADNKRTRRLAWLASCKSLAPAPRPMRRQALPPAPGGPGRNAEPSKPQQALAPEPTRPRSLPVKQCGRFLQPEDAQRRVKASRGCPCVARTVDRLPPARQWLHDRKRLAIMDYKDAYHALRSQHSDLQRKYHDRAEELKRTNVQLSKIENLMRAKERLEGGPPTTLAMREENEAIIKGLYQDKARLERRNGELDRKCRALVDILEKKKREVAVLKRAARTGPRRLDRPTTAPEHVDLGASRVSFSSSGETTGRRKNVDALVEKFKRRVEEAEDQLQRVKEDNKELRSKLQRQGRPLVVNSVKEVRSPMADKNRGFSDDNAELREAKAEAQLLEMRYKQLEENTRAQRDVQKAQFDQLDECVARRPVTSSIRLVSNTR